MSTKSHNISQNVASPTLPMLVETRHPAFLPSIMHQSIPAAPSPHPNPRPEPRTLAFFLPWMANSSGWGLLSCQITRAEDEKRGRMPRPPSTLQHSSLIEQSSSDILRILMCDFLFLLTCYSNY